MFWAMLYLLSPMLTDHSSQSQLRLGQKPVNASIIPLKIIFLNNVISDGGAYMCINANRERQDRESKHALSGKSGSKITRDPLLWLLKKEIRLFL